MLDLSELTLVDDHVGAGDDIERALESGRRAAAKYEVASGLEADAAIAVERRDLGDHRPIAAAAEYQGTCGGRAPLVRASRAPPYRNRGYALIKGHVLAAKLHAQRAGCTPLVMAPDRLPAGATVALTDKQVPGTAVRSRLLVQPASIQRDILKDRKRALQLIRREATSLLLIRVAQILLKMRHASFRGDRIKHGARRIARQGSGTGDRNKHYEGNSAHHDCNS